MSGTDVQESAAGVSSPQEGPPWTLARLFGELVDLGDLRVIVTTPGSVFECICRIRGFGIAGGWLNAMTEGYHWHIDLGAIRFARTRDEIHERSGRQVLYLELGTAPEAVPSFAIYLHRPSGEPWSSERFERFGGLREVFDGGRELVVEEAGA
ncbi:MAG TPA: hypothetical protein VGS22_20000 [Thermoanaerobaculia bacterium]|jgi:hypothetical protein|nr:hypothetical protein [Thermoanaerobaculia bacterium]